MDNMDLMRRSMDSGSLAGGALAGGMMGGGRGRAGYLGGALAGGYFTPKNPTGKRTEKKVSIEELNAREARRQYGLVNGTAKMTPEKYAKLHSDAARAKAKLARDEASAFINNKLETAYAGKSKLSYGDRTLAIALAKIEMHNAKSQDKKLAKANRTPAEVAADKAKAQAYFLKGMRDHGFAVDTKENRRAYRASRGWVSRPQTAEQKAEKKRVNSDPRVVAAKAAARASLAPSVAMPFTRNNELPR